MQSKHGLGICLIVLVAALWVGGSYLIQLIFTDTAFHKPLFLTYFTTSNFSLFLLGLLCNHPCRSPGEPAWITTGQDSDSDQSIVAVPPPVYSLRCVAKFALWFVPTWFVGNLAFNSSLATTSVASNTILCNTSSLFTFVFGLACLRAKFQWIKLLAVACTFAGVTIVALSDNSPSFEDPVFGDMMALVSAVFYSINVVLLSLFVTNEAAFPMPIFFGFIGLFTALLLWPLLPLFHALQWEPFQLPSPRILGFLFTNALIGSNLSQVLWAKSVLLTSALTATLGLSLTIPIAMLCDWILGRMRFSPIYVTGSALVVLGFVLVNCADQVQTRFARIRRSANTPNPLLSDPQL
eukprot:NODE_2344_length_1205_cov_50.674397_g2230_i0.p1 GENE.NODE_2344_length_1205_cov_50.674397_g2230_i0~~NODE_2344_length_1205_cov_50.674397_g2230_i0.p1  ORF type:complete len:358 (-),score=85.94 NODE_2344_length_1205_cov_50.674397_g2230_i0:132-1184(-)